MQVLRRLPNQEVNLISLTTSLGRGSEGCIYVVPDDTELVAKIYHKPTAQQACKLEVMLANPLENPTAGLGHISIAWPFELLWAADGSDRVVGFLMPRIRGMRPIIDFYNPKTRRQHCPLFNYQYLLRTARNLAAVFATLHFSDYCVGDVCESNILVGDTAIVTLIDTDSIQVHDPENHVVYRCLVGKPEFTPPELQNKTFSLCDRSVVHDLFGLAVLIFQLVMEGTHPFSGIFQGEGELPPYKARIAAGHFTYSQKRRVPYIPIPEAPSWEILHPSLQELFLRCFEDSNTNPSLRPTAQTWLLALADAENSLVTCTLNPQHRYSNHLETCPWCERTLCLGGRDPFPSHRAIANKEHLQEFNSNPHTEDSVQSQLPEMSNEKSNSVINRRDKTTTTTSYQITDKSNGKVLFLLKLPQQIIKRLQRVTSKSCIVRVSISFAFAEKSIVIGEEIEILLIIKQADIGKDEVYVLQIPHNEAVGNELNIILNAPGFQLNGDNTASLPLDPDTAQDTQTARFRLTALRPGNAIITAELYRGDTFETKLETQIQVADLDETTFTPQRTTQPRPIPQPDFALSIQTIWNETNSTCKFQYQLKSFRFPSVFSGNHIYTSGSLSNSWIEQVRGLLATTLENISGSLPEEGTSRLISLGQYLFQHLIPTELQSDFRNLISQNLTFTFLILADQDAWIPWELLYDGQRFLGDRFIIGRWLWELNGTIPYEFPVGAVNIAHYANVEQPQLWATLLDTLGAPPSQLLPEGILHDSTEVIRGLHLIRYSQLADAADRRNAPVTLDNINNTEDIERQMRTAKLNLRRNRSLVTLGYVKTETPELTALEQTWASAFIRAGCSGFIGSLWAVEPSVEAAFISCVYNRLWAGASLGEAFYTSRQLAHAAVPDSLDWLAYVMFGDPMARPYLPVEGKGYAVVEPIGRDIDEPMPVGVPLRFRLSLRRTPPVSHEERVMEVAENLTFENLQVYVKTFGLEVTPDSTITMSLAPTGNYLGWFNLIAPPAMAGNSALVQVFFMDGNLPIHSLMFSLNIDNKGGESALRRISSSMPTQKEFFPLEILLTENNYRISINDFSRTATDSVLLNFTKNILQVFQQIEKTINKNKQLQLTTEERDYYLKLLAKWGRRAYQEFFKDNFQKSTYQFPDSMQFAPIFVSKLVPFPWEVLYEGEYQKGDSEMFWGFRYPIARNLSPGKAASIEQVLPLNMLFCSHHKLLHAHQEERPEIEKLVRTLGKFFLLQLSKELIKLEDGEALVAHLYQTQHNILHFACHCRPCRQYEDEVDALIISLIGDESNAQEIELETYNFTDVNGNFQCQPMIFLNACQSAGGIDELRKTFNLPEKFIQRGAAAVIATACPMPDLFAAEFAKVFYKFFIDEKMMIGKALCETRRYFLEVYNNPLGLAYGLYSSPYYRIAQAPSAMRVI